MPFKKCSCLSLAGFFILFNETYSQSLGIIYEASSFNLQDFFYYDYSTNSGLIKNIFINFNTPIDDSFILSLRVGYGWNKFNFSHYDEKELHESNTSGIPVETELKYQNNLGQDSLFALLMGLGLGYYYYESTVRLAILLLNIYSNREG